MALSVKLDSFEGPLDLLLHLIDKNKIDIYDIPIVEITEQYMDYINRMETEDMNVMSEFLLMAATLLDIKCRMLLPKEEDEEGEEEDPRAELVQKLLEYKMYKYMSYELKDRQFQAEKSMFREPSFPEELVNQENPIDYDYLIGDVDLKKLHHIFKETVRRKEDKIDPIRSKFGKIEKDEVNLEEKMEYVKNLIRLNRETSFSELLDSQSTKMDVIVTFLVILELMKVGMIRIKQDEIFDDIQISYTGKENGVKNGTK